eukprot:CAMPEP_0198205976 /NCGR_PEP_ID=MMETSP1445-20131203/9506_1 /TAXON_ID=36898 /ORGANISM="Pyramimonas sp., Strain CCMP2087" /LENGTH=322 /DNA_ID=CAMNT_0043878485 /DNA_START=20 /DNA_END=984 /DNA_ORIENTATION=+
MILRVSHLIWSVFLLVLLCFQVSVEGAAKSKKRVKVASKVVRKTVLFEEFDEAEVASQPDPVWHLQQAHLLELHGNGSMARIHQLYDQSAALLEKPMSNKGELKSAVHADDYSIVQCIRFMRITMLPLLPQSASSILQYREHFLDTLPKVISKQILFEHSAEDEFWHGLVPMCTNFPPHQQYLYYGLSDRCFKAEMEQAAAMLLRVFPAARLPAPISSLHRESLHTKTLNLENPLPSDDDIPSRVPQVPKTLPRRVKVGFLSASIHDTSEMRHLGGMIKRLSSSDLEVVVIHVGEVLDSVTRDIENSVDKLVHITVPWDYAR